MAAGGAEDPHEMTTAEARPRVLVVDDDAMVRRAIERMLSSAGFEVTTVQDGHQAVHELGQSTYEAVLTDIMMPGMSGHELAARARERFPGVRIAAMSGFSAEELPQRGHVALPQLLKPFTLPQLIAFVNDAFAESRAVA